MSVRPPHGSIPQRSSAVERFDEQQWIRVADAVGDALPYAWKSVWNADPMVPVHDDERTIVEALFLQCLDHSNQSPERTVTLFANRVIR